MPMDKGGVKYVICSYNGGGCGIRVVGLGYGSTVFKRKLRVLVSDLQGNLYQTEGHPPEGREWS